MKFHKDLIIKGKVEGVFITKESDSLETSEINQLEIDLGGFIGDRHYGNNRKSGGRELHQFKRNTPIKNHRQWAAVSTEELAEIESIMQLNQLRPEWIGTNLLVSGIPSFSKLPPFSRLIIGSKSNSNWLTVYEENRPCHLPQPFINEYSGQKSAVPFSKAGMNKRGLVGWVECGGQISKGDVITVKIPDFIDLSQVEKFKTPSL